VFEMLENDFQDRSLDPVFTIAKQLPRSIGKPFGVFACGLVGNYAEPVFDQSKFKTF
jgi:hypothetical protein